jgi:hypothetical protein
MSFVVEPSILQNEKYGQHHPDCSLINSYVLGLLIEMRWLRC